MGDDPLLEDYLFSEIDVDSRYIEDVNTFLCCGDILLIVEENQNEKEKVIFEANSMMLSFYHMFRFEKQSREQDDDMIKREYVLSIDQVGAGISSHMDPIFVRQVSFKKQFLGNVKFNFHNSSQKQKPTKQHHIPEELQNITISTYLYSVNSVSNSDKYSFGIIFSYLINS